MKIIYHCNCADEDNIPLGNCAELETSPLGNCADEDNIPLGNCAELLIVPLGTEPPPEPVLIVTVTALPEFVAVTALPTKSKLRTILLKGVPSFDAVMFNPAPPPPPPDSDDKSTEFPFEILSAFVLSLNDSVCSDLYCLLQSLK